MVCARTIPANMGGAWCPPVLSLPVWAVHADLAGDTSNARRGSRWVLTNLALRTACRVVSLPEKFINMCHGANKLNEHCDAHTPIGPMV